MTDHDKHTVFDFGGEANARSLDLHAAALEALREANEELAQTHDVLLEMAAQLADAGRVTDAWRVLCYAFAAASVLLAVAVVCLVV